MTKGIHLGVVLLIVWLTSHRWGHIFLLGNNKTSIIPLSGRVAIVLPNFQSIK